MDDVSTDLKAFLDYMGGRPSDYAFVKTLSDEVALAKQNKEWRLEYMTLLMRDQENIDKGREQGMKEGLEKGEGRFAELTQKLLQDKRYIDLEKSATDPEYRQKLYKEYQVL